MNGSRVGCVRQITVMICLTAVIAVLVGCTSAPASTPEGAAAAPTNPPEPATQPAESPTESPPTEPAPTEVPPTEVPPTDTPVPTSLPALPAEPQRIEFEAADGQSLVGTYYPAEVNQADTVVLMHWAPGDQGEWVEIARWLQNRGQVGEGGAAARAWLDSSWFPPLPAEQSFAVFSFTSRGCDGGCSSFQPEGWLLDAQAAMETAKGLPGVDPKRLVVIGASIGADGAADSCDDGCLGALSLSPGSYLTVPYADAVDALGGGGTGETGLVPGSRWRYGFGLGLPLRLGRALSADHLPGKRARNGADQSRCRSRSAGADA